MMHLSNGQVYRAYHHKSYDKKYSIGCTGVSIVRCIDPVLEIGYQEYPQALKTGDLKDNFPETTAIAKFPKGIHLLVGDGYYNPVY